VPKTETAAHAAERAKLQTEPRAFVRFLHLKKYGDGTGYAFSRDVASGAVLAPTRSKDTYLASLAGGRATVIPEQGRATIGGYKIVLLDKDGEVLRAMASPQLTLRTAMTAGAPAAGDWVDINEDPAGLRAVGTIEITTAGVIERVRYDQVDAANDRVRVATGGRGVDGTTAASHGINDPIRHGEEIRPGQRVQIWSGYAPLNEADYMLEATVEVVERKNDGPVWTIETADIQRSLRRGLFLEASDADPVVLEGHPMELALRVLLSTGKGGYTLRPTDSDLTGGADFSKDLKVGPVEREGLAVTIAASATETSYGFSAAGLPGTGGDNGTYTITVNVLVANANIALDVKVRRVNSAGVVQATSALAGSQTLSAPGVKTYSINTSLGTWAAGDRLRVDYEFTNAAGSSQAVTIELGGLDTAVLTPWASRDRNTAYDVLATVDGLATPSAHVDIAGLESLRDTEFTQETITHVGSAVPAGNPTTSFTVVIPTCVTNDVLVLSVVNAGAIADPTVTDDDTDGNTWQKLHSHNNGAFNGSVWWKRATGATSGKTITVAGCTTNCAGGVSVYRGVSMDAAPYEGATGESNALGNETHAAIVPTKNGALVCLSTFQTSGIGVASQAATAPAVLDERFDKNPAAGSGCAHASAVQPTAGSTGAITWAQTDAASISIAFALKAQPQTYRFRLSTAVPDGKAWLESQIWMTTNCYPIPKANGQYSAKRMKAAPADGSVAETLGESELVSYEMLSGDRLIINEVIFQYDYNLVLGPRAYGKRRVYEVVASKEKYGPRPPLVVSAQGWRSAEPGLETMIDDRADKIFRRFAFPPPVKKAWCQYRKHHWEAGDAIKVTCSTTPNLVTGARGITNEIFEIVEIQPVFPTAQRAGLDLVLLDLEAITLTPVITEGVITEPNSPDDPKPATKTADAVYQNAEGGAAARVTMSVPALPPGARSQRLLYRRTGATEWMVAAILRNTATKSVEISGLEPGIAYDVGTVAIQPDGDESDIVLATGVPFTAASDTTAPAAPTAATINVFGRKVTLGWTKSTDHNGGANDVKEYKLYRHTSNDAGAATEIGGPGQARTRGTKFDDSTGTVGTPYWYWVTAIDYSNNESSKLALGSATPVDALKVSEFRNDASTSVGAAEVETGTVTVVCDNANDKVEIEARQRITVPSACGDANTGRGRIRLTSVTGTVLDGPNSPAEFQSAPADKGCSSAYYARRGMVTHLITHTPGAGTITYKLTAEGGIAGVTSESRYMKAKVKSATTTA
jgi:hypothetical protein